MNHEAGISAAVSACELPRNTVEKAVEAYLSKVQTSVCLSSDGKCGARLRINDEVYSTTSMRQPMTNKDMIEAVASITNAFQREWNDHIMDTGSYPDTFLIYRGTLTASFDKSVFGDRLAKAAIQAMQPYMAELTDKGE